MKVFGFEIRRTKTAPPVLSTPDSRGGWWPVAREGFAGAWQRGIETRPENALTFHAVYACVTLIAADLGKLRIKLIQRDAEGIWAEAESPAFSPVLRRPNRYQTPNKMIEQWMISKLTQGNTYVLKERDDRGVVRALYVLNPQRVRPLVAPDGAVYYGLYADDLAGLAVGDTTVVPQSEIIHDVMVPLYHPLCGVSPISACGLAAVQGLRIQQTSERFFANGSQPGGILTAPGHVTEEDRKEIQRIWDTEYTGDNAGKVAVLGNGLKYDTMSVTAVDAQLIEQLKWTAENVASAYHVPAYKIGVGPLPTYNNIEALTVDYYTQCLQSPIEHIEALLTAGLELPGYYATEFDLDGLLRMDTTSRVLAAKESIAGGGMSPNEARKKYFKLGRVTGGDAPYLQQQNYSLEALAKRDAQTDPFATAPTPATPPMPMIAPPMPEPRAMSVAEIRAAIIEGVA